MSSVRSSKVGGRATGSERPVPRLSKMSTRPIWAAREMRRWNTGSAQHCSTLETKPGQTMVVRGPSPTDW